MIAFTTRELDELYVIELDEKQSPYRVANAKGVGRRFVFDPSDDRVIFRQRAEAHPAKPERLVSCAVYLHDPQMVTNNDGPLIGPYLIGSEIVYRQDPFSPYTSLSGSVRMAGPYVEEQGRLSVRDERGRELFETAPQDSVSGFELSPDGRWVAIVLGNSAKTLEIVSTLDGTRIPIGAGRWPGWSGNSKRLVFLRDKPEIHFAEIVVYDLSKSELRSVTGLNEFWPDEPSLNFDGTRAAFVHDGALYETPTGLAP
ncbi:hypothetical protein IT157_08145 [bacterium]|nr:hypothetical protein [bacterium]